MSTAFTIIRVSTEDQLKGYGPDVQWEDDILPNASVLGLSVSEANRRVIQESATGWERSKFETAVREALSLYGKGEVDALLFPRVDRETRFIFGSFPLLAEVVKSGLRVYFAREKLALNPNDPESIERYLNKATQAQAYVETMKANTLRAKQRLVREGKLPQGTGKGLYGYKWDKENKKRIPIEYEVKVAEKIFEMLASGVTRFKIATALNEQGIPSKTGGKWHPLTIQRLVTNPAYIGITYYYQTKGSRKTALIAQEKNKWAVLKDVTPAIISRELFDRAQQQLQRQKEARHSTDTRHYLLRGFAYCGHCGSPLVGTCLNRKVMYYHCRGTYPTSARKAICNAKYIQAEMLEALVWDRVKATLSNPDIVLAELKKQSEAAKTQNNATSPDKEIKVIERQLKDYPNQEKRLINALRTGQFTQDYILDEINRTKADREGDLKRLNELKQVKILLANLEKAEIKLGEFYATVKKSIEQCTFDYKRLAFEALALRVKATPERADIAGTIPIEITTTQSSGQNDPLLTIEQTSA
jgi:site-specific DNA recombinase